VVGLSNSLFGPASRAIAIADGDADMPKRLGTLTGVDLAGFVTGPMIGALLVGPFGLRVPFLVAGSFALAAALMLAPRHLAAPPLDDIKRLAFDLLRLPRIRASVLMCVPIPADRLHGATSIVASPTSAAPTGSSAQLSPTAFLRLLATTGGRLASEPGRCGSRVQHAVGGTLTWPMGSSTCRRSSSASAVEGSLQASRSGQPGNGGPGLSGRLPRRRARGRPTCSSPPSPPISPGSTTLRPEWMFTTPAPECVRRACRCASAQPPTGPKPRPVRHHRLNHDGRRSAGRRLDGYPGAMDSPPRRSVKAAHPRATRRAPLQARSAETRRRLLDAGFDAFAAKGHDGVNLVEDVLVPAGISIGSFYHQFSDKTELLREILGEAADRRRAFIAQLGRLDPETTLDDAVRAIVERLYDSLATETTAWQLQRSSRISGTPGVREMGSANRENWTDQLAELLTNWYDASPECADWRRTHDGVRPRLIFDYPMPPPKTRRTAGGTRRFLRCRRDHRRLGPRIGRPH
jgi:AcrR family transcriptional regulator